MLSPEQLRAYGLSDEFMQYNLVVKSVENNAPSGTDCSDVIESRVYTGTLSGGGGADVFTYGSDSSNFTTIMDFNRAEGDKIHLSGIDADMNRPGNQSFLFSGQTPFPHSVWYKYVGHGRSHVVLLFADTDGITDGVELFIALSDVPSLQVSDLFL